MKFKYDAENDKVIITANDAKDLRMYVTGYNVAAKRAGIPDELRKVYLGIDLMHSASGIPNNMDPSDFLKLLRTASAAMGVKLYEI